MALFRHTTPVSRDDLVHVGMGGITGANSDLHRGLHNLPEYVRLKLSGSVQPDVGVGPGHNPMYGSIGNDGTPVRSQPLTHKVVPIRKM